MANSNILILGVGNILLGDEGFGPCAIDYLKSRYNWPEGATLLDGGTGGLMLMADLMECGQAVILDVMLGGHEPGTFYLLEDKDMALELKPIQSAHQTGVFDLLINCGLAGKRPPAIIFAMEPFDYQTMRPSLTPQAQAQLPLFCSKVVAYLQKNFDLDIQPLPE